MAFGDGLKDMVRRYEGHKQELISEVPKQLSLTTAFIVEKVKQYTPPTEAEKYNANATGDLKAHWSEDSFLIPMSSNGTHTTVIANNLQWASYVENGHRMDRHFVPGLHIVGGQLVKDDAIPGGIVVGTKTKYVRGVYMLERAMREGESNLQQGMRRVLMSVMKKEG
jgi:hypothetical protein